ncbi:hypothetical protein HNP30_002318 [Chromobacterium alkanivorans]|uniref:hypothetical protein n=1 Tax=Chromobacterium alkanivorans TaxID=1071719 RepID=UPI00216841E5|nr:hypothetical protein [Chromobacterium alkanivorans]MCS3818972.1 hypothetical protein [Chromobacterium alkanivorans]
MPNGKKPINYYANSIKRLIFIKPLPAPGLTYRRMNRLQLSARQPAGQPSSKARQGIAAVKEKVRSDAPCDAPGSAADL